jgi:hypothetical protein
MKLEMKKFGEILVSRPAGRDAALAMKSFVKVAPEEMIELDFEGVLSVAPSWLDEVLSALGTEFGPNRIRCLDANNPSVIESLKAIEEQRAGRSL